MDPAEVFQPNRQNLLALGWGVLIGIPGGLIGLGGAEFRLPVLVGVFKYPILKAIVINLVVSLVTVVFSFILQEHPHLRIPLSPAAIPGSTPFARTTLPGRTPDAPHCGTRYLDRLGLFCQFFREVAIVVVLVGALG
jgi:hypothetical protein